MSDSQLRILIDALWRGKGAAGQARSDIAGIGASSDSASLQMAALAQRSSLLQGKMAELGRAVAEGSKSIDDATQEYQEFRDSLAQIDPVAQKNSSSISSLISIYGKLTLATGAAAIAAKKAFDFSEEGASLNQLEASFNRLNASVLQTPGLLQDLKDASRETLTEAQLMQGVLKLVAGASSDVARELAAASPQLMEIAKAAQKLNPHLGDTAFLYDSITTGIKRASPMILDNLGIIVKVGEANEKYAASLGKTVAQLTAEEKQIALLNATLEAGNNLIQQVGGNIDSQADDWLRLRANIAEAGDAFKKNFADGLSEMNWDQLNRDVSELSSNLADLTGVTLKLIGPLQSLADIGRKIMEFPLSPPGFLMMLVDLVNGSNDATFAMSAAQLEAARYEDALRGAMSAGQGASAAQIELASSTTEVQRGFERAITPADEFSRRLAQLSQGVGVVHVGVTTNIPEAETQIEQFITDYQGRKIALDVSISEQVETPRHGELLPGQDAVQRLIDQIQGQVDFELRIPLSAQAELDEKAWRKEMQDLAAEIKDAAGLGPAAPFEIPISPSVEMESARQDVEAGIVDLQTLIDMNPPKVTPDVDNSELEEMVAFLEGDVQGSIDGVFGEIYELETQDNLPLLDTRLQGVLDKINAAKGTHHIHFAFSTSGGGAPAIPSGGGAGGGNLPSFHAPSLGFGATSGAGGAPAINLHPGAIVINGVSDPERAANAVIQKLQDRGMMPRVTLR